MKIIIATLIFLLCQLVWSQWLKNIAILLVKLIYFSS